MIYLASASPRRQELLRQVGLEYQVIPADIHEAQQPGETPFEYVCRVAADKARTVAARIRSRGLAVHPVLGADTEVVVDGEILGKPRDRIHARQMLTRLAGRSHAVVTALCLLTPAGALEAVSESRVTFAPLTDAEIGRYVDGGEADDKAGGYAIQGRAAGFISRIEGSYSGVMGLPLHELCATLKRAGMEYL